MAKTKTVFFCTSCGNTTPRWQGRCPSCGEWNTIEEHIEKQEAVGKRTQSFPVGHSRKPQRISEVSSEEELRVSTGMGELDRVLGGGAVTGSLVLVSGAPGIGKSTLLLQICSCLCRNQKVLYVSGEESERQLKMRAERLCVNADNLYVLSETRLSDILESVSEIAPDILIVDSIQTLYNDENESSPGSVSQVKDCTMALLSISKSQGITVFVVGHINKDGNIAGPKVLEHMVDCVLYFEGDRNSSYRLLRAAKNRFGSTNEIGVFEMRDIGLAEIPNPSEMLLSGRPKDASGTCVACVMEGSRPILAEVQSLVTRSAAANPRRAADGFDYNRAVLILAVMEKRLSMKLSSYDAYINVIGGLYLDEPGADLPVVLALASSYREKCIANDLAAIGEVGMTGEIRSVSHLDQRLAEIARLGFKKCIIPRIGSDKVHVPEPLTVYRVRNIHEAIETAIE